MREVTLNLLADSKAPYELALYHSHLTAAESLEVPADEVLVKIGDEKTDKFWGRYKEYELSFGENMNHSGEIRLSDYETAALIEELTSGDGILRKFFVNLDTDYTYTFI